MRLYDFSIYAERRKLKKAAEAVANTATDLQRPGAVIQLKTEVRHWFALHQEVSRKVK